MAPLSRRRGPRLHCTGAPPPNGVYVFSQGGGPWTEGGQQMVRSRPPFFQIPFGLGLTAVVQEALRVRGLRPVSRDPSWRALFSRRLHFLYLRGAGSGSFATSVEHCGGGPAATPYRLGPRARRIRGELLPSHGACLSNSSRHDSETPLKFHPVFPSVFRVSKRGLVKPSFC